MKKKAILITAIVVAGALLLCSVVWCIKNKTPDANKQSVETIMADNTTIEISNARDAGDDLFVADVKITMPDILAIYKYLRSVGKTDGMTLSDIYAAISEYTKDANYMTHHTVSAPVRKEGEKWVLTSTDCVDEIIRETANNLLTQVINELGALGLGEEDEFVWEEKQ